MAQMIDVMAEAGSIPAYPYEAAEVARLAQPQLQSLTLKCGGLAPTALACASLRGAHLAQREPSSRILPSLT